MSQKTQRKPYSDNENRALIDCWQRSGSVVLISMLLGRSESSVQTQASRLGLPRREDRKDNPQRAWTDEEIDLLDDLIAELSDDDGSIPVTEIARRMERSVEAVIVRLRYEYGDDKDELLRRIILPPTEERPAETPQDLVKSRGKLPQPKRNRSQDRGPGTRTCLSCQKTFYSEHAGHRICNHCKRAHEEEL